MSESGLQLKIAVVGLAGSVVFAGTFGDGLHERVVNLAVPLANALDAGTVSASGPLYLNFDLASVDPQQPDHLTAERPPFDSGGATPIVVPPEMQQV